MEPLCVMVVDDELGMRTGAERALHDYRVKTPDGAEEISFSVISAESGEEALQIISKTPPDILLLDYKLPGMTGLDLLVKLAAGSGDMLVIMITAYASIETAVQATRQGAYDFLPKPFTPAELRDVIRRSAMHVVLTRQARQMAEEKKRVRFEFIRVLGHELKAPLAAVEGYINIMKDETLGPQLAPYKEMISRSHVRLEQMKKLIVDLLDMTRIEAGQKVRHVEKIDICAALRDAVELVRPAAKERGIKGSVQCPEHYFTMADRSEMDMIFSNLLTNAVKYNRDDGTVEAVLTPGEGQVEIRVTDTGIGMSPEEQEKLFGEFVRIKNDQTRNILGSGLGLSIIKRLVELYHGSITVKSEAGKGSTFTAVLKLEKVE